MAADNIVVMPGSGGIDNKALHTVAGEFGWGIEITNNLTEVAAAQPNQKTVAALFCCDALGPGYSSLETTRILRRELPEVRLIVCHGFAEAIDWPDLSDAGAFHELMLPLKENEVRLCLGFVWQAENRRADSAESLRMVQNLRAIQGLNAVRKITAQPSRSRRVSSPGGGFSGVTHRGS
jgi:hypothetical protein